MEATHQCIDEIGGLDNVMELEGIVQYPLGQLQFVLCRVFFGAPYWPLCDVYLVACEEPGKEGMCNIWRRHLKWRGDGIRTDLRATSILRVIREELGQEAHNHDLEFA